jgi:hypothetical protein
VAAALKAAAAAAKVTQDTAAKTIRDAAVAKAINDATAHLIYFY